MRGLPPLPILHSRKASTFLARNIGAWNEIGDHVESTFPLDEVLDRAPAGNLAVLDYGCGTGRLTEWLHRFDFTNVTGLDPSEKMIEKARRKNPEGRFEHVPFSIPPELRHPVADLVVLVGVLSSVPSHVERERFIANLGTWCRPGGVLCFGDFGVSTSAPYRERYRHPVLEPMTFVSAEGILIHHFALDEVVDLFSNQCAIHSQKTILVRTIHGNSIPGHIVIARVP